jgi:hypothetical protein
MAPGSECVAPQAQPIEGREAAIEANTMRKAKRIIGVYPSLDRSLR